MFQRARSLDPRATLIVLLFRPSRSKTGASLSCLLAAAVLVTAGIQTTPQSTGPRELLRARLETLRESPSATIRGERLLQPSAVAAFFEARGFEPAWKIPEHAQAILAAIKRIDEDGLSPGDYHLSAIENALTARSAKSSLDLDADLQVLLSDSVAGLVDHVRYGKVQPARLDRRWNVDPRAAAAPLETLLAEVAAAPAPGDAIASLKPGHFIYVGLKKELGRLRTIAAAGGWPQVPAGRSLKPGARDPRVVAIRKRLVSTGELPSNTSPQSDLYDAELEAAVKRFQEHHRLTAEGTIGRMTLDEMNTSVASRVGQLRINLERARWVVGGLSNSFLLVNLPAFKVYYIRDGKNVWETRAQIGKQARETPAFRADLRYIVFNPDWTVPPTILEQDVLAGMRKGQNPIARKGLTILDQPGQSRRSRFHQLGRSHAQELRLHGAATARAGECAGPREVHLSEHTFHLSPRHAQPRAVRRRSAHVQFRMHPDRASARPRADAARRQRLDEGTDPDSRRRRNIRDGLSEAAASGADRVLDSQCRRLGRAALCARRLRPRHQPPATPRHPSVGCVPATGA